MDPSDTMVVSIPVVLAERARDVAVSAAAGQPDVRRAAEVAIELADYLALPVE